MKQSTHHTHRTKTLIAYIESHEKQLYRLAYSYVKEEGAALDVVQDAIVKALCNIENLRNMDGLKTWMYRIVVNAALDHIRKNRKVLYMEALPEQMEVASLDTADKLDLYEAVDQLDQKARTVIVLRYFEDMKLDDIARVTQTSLSTVKSRLYTSVRKLRRILNVEGLE